MKLRRRPALPVDLGAIERELLDNCGSVSAAARALGVSSVDLRRLVGSQPLLADAIYEWTERAIDEAVQVLRDGLRHPDKSQRLAAAALRHCGFGGRPSVVSSSASAHSLHSALIAPDLIPVGDRRPSATQCDVGS
jgi:hypothetical protein